MKKIIFISGVHGVGKSTLCDKVNDYVELPSYSCSSIIKANSQYIETSKFVDKAEANQVALVNGLSRLPDGTILLDGHFCLVGKDSQIIELDFAVFDSISPSLIINVVADHNEIQRRLLARDGSAMDLSLIVKLQAQETSNAHAFSRSRGIPIVNYESGTDITDLLKFISQ